jgi:hypothetical protein
MSQISKSLTQMEDEEDKKRMGGQSPRSSFQTLADQINQPDHRHISAVKTKSRTSKQSDSKITSD